MQVYYWHSTIYIRNVTNGIRARHMLEVYRNKYYREQSAFQKWGPPYESMGSPL